jgi:hypothetical protein
VSRGSFKSDNPALNWPLMLPREMHPRLSTLSVDNPVRKMPGSKRWRDALWFGQILNSSVIIQFFNKLSL